MIKIQSKLAEFISMLQWTSKCTHKIINDIFLNNLIEIEADYLKRQALLSSQFIKFYCT
jgi:hypothetical protein